MSSTPTLFAELWSPPVMEAPLPPPTTANPSSRSSPWQRRGTTLLAEATTDPDRAMRAAGLAWEVERVGLRTEDLDPVPDAVAMRRSDTGAVLGVVGLDYTPLQNAQMFGVFRDLARIDGVRARPFTIETAGTFHGGKVVWALAHIPDLGIRIGDDEARTYLLVSNGHTGNKVLTIAPTTVRVVCQNTLRMAEAGAAERRRRGLGLSAGFTLRHTPGLHEALSEVTEAYAATMRAHQVTVEAWTHLASRPLTTANLDALQQAVYGKPGPDEADRARAMRLARQERIAAILASPTSQVRGTKDTVFSAMQAIIEYIDHERPTRTGEGGDPDEQRLWSASFGSGAELKATVFEAAMQVAA